ncbi:DUF4349 domain-containing protein [Umezawaea endophytica]|uniref:DUF4349 domain-containing protein n=1 Tax=Umezawaea endophytica TaxID=1654476 RepID=A0A9X2VU69_9PSEU|nr:DUF4349 domain-containing protein [Umezawaea endophytica]MCS7483036.1 DUF4349 domain-containing protein [Umezawaea endophytica]
MSRRVLAVAALALVALAGCSAQNASSGGAAEMAAPPAQGVAPGVAKDSAGTANAEAKQPDSVAQNRQLVRTAQVDLRGDDVSGALVKVKDLVAREGGFVGQENSTASMGSVTLRVPVDRMDAVLKGLGEVEGTTVARRETKSEDVTEQVVDVEARLATQRASVDRVRALLERATTTAEIVDIEGELTKRQSELESLQRRYDSLKGQVAQSTITVSIRQGAAPVAAEEKLGFLGALESGWHALLEAFRVVAVVIGAVLPFAIVLVPVGVLWVLRRRRRTVKITPAPSSN